MSITKSDFEEMVRDYIADNAEELEDLTIDSTEKNNGVWTTYAHDANTSYMLFDNGTGDIQIAYLAAN